MTTEETIVIKCKNCGEPLTIPKRLEEFSCMYCGEKMKTSEFNNDPQRNSDAQECYEYAMENMIRCISEHRDIHKGFNKNTYTNKIQSYKEDSGEIIEKLNHAILMNPENSQKMLECIASRFLDDLEKLWDSDPRGKSKHQRKVMMEDDRLLIAIYMIPMIRDLKLPTTKDTAIAIHTEWLRRYPKTPFYLAKKSDIQQGFKRKICFITTAVCRSEGKPDDCYELETLRSFRDGYLAALPEGPALINEYYDIAPMIVACIDYADDSAARYAELREQYIVPCISDIEAGRLEACQHRYVDMVKNLRRRYLPA